jgi:formate/nitrite transporter FocA (FNT family)
LDRWRDEFSPIGQQAMQGGFAAHIIRGGFAGWLIALMVWVLPFAESARIWARRDRGPGDQSRFV